MVRLTPFRAEWPHLRPLDLRVRIACAGRELPGGPLLVGICLVDLSCFPLPGAPRYGFNLFKSGRAKSVLVMRLCHQQSHIPENSIKRSEEHTSELQSLTNLVCRLLLEKKKKKVHYVQLSETNKN